MKRRLFSRLGQSALTLTLLSLGVFLLLHAIPGGPLDHLLRSGDGGVAPADLRRVEALLGLELPWWQRYLRWLGAWLSGDWGRSWGVALQEPVRSLVLLRLQRTALMGALALALALAASLALAAWLAQRPGRGRALLTALSALHSIPSFCVAVLALALAGSLGLPLDGLDGSWAFALWPAGILALLRLNEWTRLFRNEIEGILAQPYVLAARAKGVGGARLLWRHVAPNLGAAVSNIVALDLPVLVAGALVVEAVFSYPGLGLLAYHAVQANDWPVVQSIALLTGILVSLANAGADSLRWALDPRQRERA
jgi:peptide/nickel transport system permease protein